jgi:hypothetical protein
LNLRWLIVVILMLLADAPRHRRCTAHHYFSQHLATSGSGDRPGVAIGDRTDKIYAHGAMDYWRTRVYELTEQNFIPWFSSYWTQEWLSMKVSWYTINAKGEQDATEKRLAAYLLEQYQERSWRRWRWRSTLMRFSAWRRPFTWTFSRKNCRKFPAPWRADRATQWPYPEIPAIALGPPPARDASLYQVVYTDLNTLPAYSALVDKIHKAGGNQALARPTPPWRR